MPRKKLNKREKAKKKRELAHEMILDGMGNVAIMASIKKKFGDGIGSDTLSKLRKALDMNGNKARHKKDDNKVLILQTSETNPAVKQLVTHLVNVMKAEKIKSIHITNEGHVEMLRMEVVEFSV